MEMHECFAESIIECWSFQMTEQHRQLKAAKQQLVDFIEREKKVGGLPVVNC